MSKALFLASAWNNAEEGLAYLSLDGCCTRVNATLCRLLGYDAKEILGLPLLAFASTRDLRSISLQLLNTLNGQIDEVRSSTHLWCKDDTVIAVSIHWSLIRESENSSYFVASITLEQRGWDPIVCSTNDRIGGGIVIGVNEKGRIVKWPVQATTLLGWQSAHALQQSVSLLLIPPRFWNEHYMAVANWLRESSRVDVAQVLETPVLTRDGNEIKTAISLQLIRSSRPRTAFLFSTAEDKIVSASTVAL